MSLAIARTFAEGSLRSRPTSLLIIDPAELASAEPEADFAKTGFESKAVHPNPPSKNLRFIFKNCSPLVIQKTGMVFTHAPKQLTRNEVRGAHRDFHAD